MRLWGAVMRDMVTGKYVAEAARTPHSPKGSQLERCSQYGPTRPPRLPDLAKGTSGPLVAP